MAEHDQPRVIYLRERWSVVWLPQSHTADLKTQNFSCQFHSAATLTSQGRTSIYGSSRPRDDDATGDSRACTLSRTALVRKSRPPHSALSRSTDASGHRRLIQLFRRDSEFFGHPSVDRKDSYTCRHIELVNDICIARATLCDAFWLLRRR